MRQFRSYGSARGDARKGVPYRDPNYNRPGNTGKRKEARGQVIPISKLEPVLIVKAKPQGSVS